MYIIDDTFLLLTPDQQVTVQEHLECLPGTYEVSCSEYDHFNITLDEGWKITGISKSVMAACNEVKDGKIISRIEFCFIPNEPVRIIHRRRPHHKEGE